jgi:hypothetical protein
MLLAKPLVSRSNLDYWKQKQESQISASAEESPEKPSKFEEQVYFRNIKDLWKSTKPGEVRPGHNGVSALRTAQGVLARGTGRRYKWIKKPRSGVNERIVATA